MSLFLEALKKRDDGRLPDVDQVAPEKPESLAPAAVKPDRAVPRPGPVNLVLDEHQPEPAADATGREQEPKAEMPRSDPAPPDRSHRSRRVGFIALASAALLGIAYYGIYGSRSPVSPPIPMPAPAMEESPGTDTLIDAPPEPVESENAATEDRESPSEADAKPAGPPEAQPIDDSGTQSVGQSREMHRQPVDDTEPATPIASHRPAASYRHRRPEFETAPEQAIIVTRGKRQGPAADDLMRAYRALLAGQLRTARTLYAGVLRHDPNNRDALLGLATIEHQEGDTAGAIDHYRRVVALDPQNPTAQAALVTLTPSADAVQTESRLKNLLAAQPASASLWFTLGHYYAEQSRWSEAEEAFFKALERQADNADFSYNLAVSLDRLGHTAAALNYYRQTLNQTLGQPVHFDVGDVQNRIRQITQIH